MRWNIGIVPHSAFITTEKRARAEDDESVAVQSPYYIESSGDLDSLGSL